ncbi:MAG: hypothetical protein AAGG81_01930 [Chlamydiota bacterium]
MGIEPPYTGKIEVKTLNDKTIYEKTFSDGEELRQFVKTYSQSKPGYSFLRGMIYPLRTDNVEHFLEDFFFPNIVDTCKKTDNVALRIFVCFFAGTADVVTFPIRLVTAPFRAIYNHQNPDKKHPLVELLEGKGISVDEDVIALHCKEVTEKAQADQENHYKDSKIIAEGVITVALKRIIGGAGNEKNCTKIQSIPNHQGPVKLGERVPLLNSKESSGSFYDYLFPETAK